MRDYFKSFANSLPKNYNFKRLDKVLVFSPSNLLRTRVLIVAGLHGDELAGPLGILKFLNQSNAREILDRLSVSFIPIVNYYGYENNTRGNEEQLDINKDYEEADMSDETKSILDNSNFIVSLATKGFITLHEDDTKTGFYTYTYGDKQQLFDPIIELGNKFFGIQQGRADDKYDIENGEIKDLVDEDFKSFEDFLVDKGIDGICTETPATEKLAKRIEANRQIINIFLRYFLL